MVQSSRSVRIFCANLCIQDRVIKIFNFQHFIIAVVPAVITRAFLCSRNPFKSCHYWGNGHGCNGFSSFSISSSSRTVLPSRSILLMKTIKGVLRMAITSISRLSGFYPFTLSITSNTLSTRKRAIGIFRKSLWPGVSKIDECHHIQSHQRCCNADTPLPFYSINRR